MKTLMYKHIYRKNIHFNEGSTYIQLKLKGLDIHTTYLKFGKCGQQWIYKPESHFSEKVQIYSTFASGEAGSLTCQLTLLLLTPRITPWGDHFQEFNHYGLFLSQHQS